MTNTQYPSDQSLTTVLCAATERIAGHRFGIGEPDAEEIRYLDESESFEDAIAWDEAWAEWQDRDYPDEFFEGFGQN